MSAAARARTWKPADRSVLSFAAVGVAGLRREIAVDPELLPDRRFELLEAIWEKLEERARVAPALLLVDDVQWADPATLLALRILPRRRAGSGVAAVLALRPTPRPAALSRVLGTVEQGHGLHIRLGPLGGSGWRRSGRTVGRRTGRGT